LLLPKGQCEVEGAEFGLEPDPLKKLKPPFSRIERRFADSGEELLRRI
jgi:hypothetical protein